MVRVKGTASNIVTSTFTANTFGWGEVIGDGSAAGIVTGNVLTVNGHSCSFVASSGPSNTPMMAGSITNSTLIDGTPPLTDALFWWKGWADLTYFLGYYAYLVATYTQVNVTADYEMLMFIDHTASNHVMRTVTNNGTIDIYLPDTVILVPGAYFYYYVADDGSTYYARADHLEGAPNLTPAQAMVDNVTHLARSAGGGAMTWDTVKTQLDASAIGLSGDFTITRSGVAGEVDIKVDDDYTEITVDHDDTGLFTANHTIYTGKKRGVEISMKAGWDISVEPIVVGVIKKTGVWTSLVKEIAPLTLVYTYSVVTGLVTFLATDNCNNDNRFKANDCIIYLIKE